MKLLVSVTRSIALSSLNVKVASALASCLYTSPCALSRFRAFIFPSAVVFRFLDPPADSNFRSIVAFNGTPRYQGKSRVAGATPMIDTAYNFEDFQPSNSVYTF